MGNAPLLVSDATLEIGDAQLPMSQLIVVLCHELSCTGNVQSDMTGINYAYDARGAASVRARRGRCGRWLFSSALRIAQEPQLTLVASNSIRVRINSSGVSANGEGNAQTGNNSRATGGGSDASVSAEVRGDANVNAGNGTASTQETGRIRANLEFWAPLLEWV